MIFPPPPPGARPPSTAALSRSLTLSARPWSRHRRSAAHGGLHRLAVPFGWIRGGRRPGRSLLPRPRRGRATGSRAGRLRRHPGLRRAAALDAPDPTVAGRTTPRRVHTPLSATSPLPTRVPRATWRGPRGRPCGRHHCRHRHPSTKCTQVMAHHRRLTPWSDAWDEGHENVSGISHINLHTDHTSWLPFRTGRTTPTGERRRAARPPPSPPAPPRARSRDPPNLG